MRLGVLDVGSNTVHMLVVDAKAGGAPTAMSSTKAVLRLAEQIDDDGRMTKAGADSLVSTIEDFTRIAESSGCGEIMAFATSATRDATNSDEVLRRVKKTSGLDVVVLSGVDEEPDIAISLPLGAGRVTREWIQDDPPDRRRIAVLRDWLDAELKGPAKELRAPGKPSLAVGSSKTFRSLARLTGAAPSSAGPRVQRSVTQDGIRQLISFISRMTTADRAELEGVSADRAPQIVAGALVAEATMRALGVDRLEICPWALREGVILRRLDSEPAGPMTTDH